MSAQRRMVEVTRLKKSSWLVYQETKAVVKESRQAISRQERFMNEVGMDKKNLRSFINNEAWPVNFKHKARQELVKFNEDLKRDMSNDASIKRKEIRQASRLLTPKSQSGTRPRRRKTGFV